MLPGGAGGQWAFLLECVSEGRDYTDRRHQATTIRMPVRPGYATHTGPFVHVPLHTSEPISSTKEAVMN